MLAIFFGSISTVADTSELQRAAFNAAFAQHGLSWHWEPDEYRSLLGHSGGQDRVAAYAVARDEQVDATAVHATKSSLFQEHLATTPLTPRPGVTEVISAAHAADMEVGLVTSTSAANVDALLLALSPHLTRESFEVVVDAETAERAKPDPAAYLYALDRLGETPAQCIAIEDNPDGVRSATSAGLACVAFPNANTAGLDFVEATRRVERLDFVEIQQLLGNAS